jgi:hypothetical protein
MATQAQCNAIVDRYVDLTVHAEAPDASVAEVSALKEKVREMAETDEDFRSCATHVESAQYDCAMRAPSADAIEKCLE